MQHDRIAAEVGFMFNHFPETEMDNFWMWNINESSKPPMEVFKIAGVDMTSTQSIEDAFEVLGEYIDRLKSLTK